MTDLSRQPAAPLRIGSWPGRGPAANAFLDLLLGALAAEGVEVVDFQTSGAVDPSKVDVVLLHWAEGVFAEASSGPAALVAILGLLRRIALRPRGVKVVWVAHNLAPHEMGRLLNLVWRPYLNALCWLSDGVLTLSPGTVDIVRAAVPALRRRSVGAFWHPSYPDTPLTAAERAAARASYGWSEAETVIGCCGLLRPYKGVEDLVAVFRASPDPSLRLLIAGQPVAGALEAAVRAAARADARITLDLRRLDAGAFRSRLGLCDLAAAPFRRYLHSGSVLHAFSLGVPVLTPATPFSAALRDATSATWFRLHDGPLTPEVLAAAVAAGRATPPPPVDRFSPARAARDILAFLDGVGARSRRSPDGDHPHLRQGQPT